MAADRRADATVWIWIRGRRERKRGPKERRNNFSSLTTDDHPCLLLSRVNAPFQPSFLQWSHLLVASLPAFVRPTNDATDLHINRDLPTFSRYGPSVMVVPYRFVASAARSLAFTVLSIYGTACVRNRATCLHFFLFFFGGHAVGNCDFNNVYSTIEWIGSENSKIRTGIKKRSSWIIYRCIGIELRNSVGLPRERNTERNDGKIFKS